MNLSRINGILNWSVRVGRLFGIPIFLHITLVFFLIPLIAGRGLDFGHSLEYIVAVVLCVLLHELGHGLAAKHYRLSGLSITLHGFGGFAVSSGYRSPSQALAITLAGPAVTFAIGFIALAIGSFGMQTATLGTEAFTQFYLIKFLGTFNLVMGILNLIPAFPFDGGNALKAILSRKQSDFKATRIVGHVGLPISAAVAAYGLLADQRFVAIFGFIGFVSSLVTLLNSGGVRFGEMFADRRAHKESQAVRQRQKARDAAYLSDVDSRQKEREERDRLRRILESTPGDE